MTLSPELVTELVTLSSQTDRRLRILAVSEVFRRHGIGPFSLCFYLGVERFELCSDPGVTIARGSEFSRAVHLSGKSFSLTGEFPTVSEEITALQKLSRISRPRKTLGVFPLRSRGVVEALILIGVESRLRGEDEQICRGIGDLLQLVHSAAETASRAARESQDAWAVQKSYLPAAGELPQIPGLDYECFIRPAAAVGGDYYDVRVERERFAVFVVGDVVGKGPAAALVMSSIISQLRREISPRLSNLTDLVTTLNWLAYSAARRYTSLFILVMDVIDMALRYVSAGHQPPTLLFRPDGTVIELTEGGPPLGLTERPLGPYTVGVAQVNYGDFLLLATDGIIDAEDTAGVHFGTDRLIEIAKKRDQKLTAKAFVESLVAEVDAFVGINEQKDDLTLVAIKIGYSGNAR